MHEEVSDQKKSCEGTLQQRFLRRVKGYSNQVINWNQTHSLCLGRGSNPISGSSFSLEKGYVNNQLSYYQLMFQ